MMSKPGKGVMPYLYLLPIFLFFVPFVLAPFAHTVALSLYDWDGLTEPVLVGMSNYREALSSPLVGAAFLHALVLIIFFGVAPILLALPIAAISAHARVPGDAGLRTLIFLPQAMSTVVIGVSWSWIMAFDGPINGLLNGMGWGALSTDWLGSFAWALPAVGVIGAWTLTGLCVALFVAGLQQVPASLYEAAAVDGAGYWRGFLAVTLPGLRGPIVVALTVTVIAALRAFDLVFVTTRGGPGTQTMVPGMLIYRRAFEDGRLGSAAAIAVCLSVVVFAFAFAINAFFDRRTP